MESTVSMLERPLDQRLSKGHRKESRCLGINPTGWAVGTRGKGGFMVLSSVLGNPCKTAAGRLFLLLMVFGISRGPTFASDPNPSAPARAKHETADFNRSPSPPLPASLYYPGVVPQAGRSGDQDRDLLKKLGIAVSSWEAPRIVNRSDVSHLYLAKSEPKSFRKAISDFGVYFLPEYTTQPQKGLSLEEILIIFSIGFPLILVALIFLTARFLIKRLEAPARPQNSRKSRAEKVELNQA